MVGIFITLVVFVSAIALLVRLRLFMFFSFGKLLYRLLSELKRGRVRRSFFLALSGTLGVGNIVGVAVGLIVGGSGSVFWLVASAVFSMMLKYAESSLASAINSNSNLGMISLIENSYLRFGKLLSKAYAVLCIFLAFFMGAMLQSSSVCISLFRISGIPYWVIGALLCLLVILAVASKTSGIMSTVSWLLPIASAFYLLLCLACLLKGGDKLPGVFADIISRAFAFSSFSGGVIGFIVSSGIKEGFSRGLLSNEAGAGTSTLAHSTNHISSPSNVGILGMGEVIVDTVIFCPATALAILVSIGDISLYSTGIELVMASLGNAFFGSGFILSLCIFVFAYATVICWFYYGSLSVKYVFGKGTFIFAFLYIASVFLGSVINDVLVVGITDVLLLFMTLLTVTTLIKRSDKLVELSEHAGLIRHW